MAFSPLLLFGLGGAIALILLVVGVITSITGRRSIVDERLEEYSDQEEQQLPKDMTPPVLTTWLNKQVERSSFGERISKDLARADLKMKPGEFIATQIIATFGVGFVGWFIGGQSIIVAIVGAAIGYALPGMYVGRQKSRRLIRFNDQLADMLNLVVNGLRAGFSTTQAMETISKELPAPISNEFRRVVQEMQLGVSMETALDNLLRRIPSDDLDLVITAINVQREVGGNLAEILDTISFTIRERVRIKGEIRVFTSQVMYSGRFLAMMPVFIMAILYLMNRPYLEEFIKEENFPCGYIALGTAFLLIILGYFAMNKLSDIEI